MKDRERPTGDVHGSDGGAGARDRGTGVTAYPSVSDAKLPRVYESACEALAKCQQIDECKEWADKSAAMASYARQAGDKTLLTTATRIKARAIRRCGELLRQIAPSKPGGVGGGAPTSARKAAARTAGLSRDQQIQAQRVAAVSRDAFESAIESKSPATIERLAAMGKQAAAGRAHLASPKPPGFKAATRTLGLLQEFAKFAGEADVALIVEALDPHEKKALVANAKVSVRWIGRLIANIRRTP